MNLNDLLTARCCLDETFFLFVMLFFSNFPSASSAFKPIRISKTRIRVPFEKKESQLHALSATPPALAMIRHATDGMDPLLAAETPGAVTASPNTLGVHSWSAVGGSASSDGGAAGAAAAASAAASADLHVGNAMTPQQLARKVVQGLWAAPTSEEMQLERAATSMAALNDEVLLRFSILDTHFDLMASVALCVSHKHAWLCWAHSKTSDRAPMQTIQ